MIRIIIIFFISVIFSVVRLSGKEVSVITGCWEKKNIEIIRLYEISNGNLYEISSSHLNADKEFYLAFAARKEGFYAIGTQKTQPKDRYLFYFKPGDNLNVRITNDGYSLYGDNTAENKELEKWQTILNPLEAETIYRKTSSVTYKEFFPLLEEKIKEANAYPEVSTGNKDFDKAFSAYRQLSLLDQALLFLYTPRKKQPGTLDYSSYYSQVTLTDIASQTLLNYPGSIEMLTRFIHTQEQIKGRQYKSQSELLEKGFIENAFTWLSDKELQGEIILSFARHTKTYEGLDAYRKKYRQYLFTDSQKLRMDEIVMAAFKPDKGENAIDFTFPDIEGNEIALSDLKGKAVYIDVWATWCMPCQKEIPYLKKLEHEYEGKNIIFLSISTDQGKDYEKWKTFVEKEGLGGIQLFAGDRAREELLKPYKITGVPRFMLVNKEGQIVNSNAPRPSSGEIRLLLNAVL